MIALTGASGEVGGRVSLHRNAVDAALAADATFTFARDHFHTEQHVRGSGLRWTFLRDSIYLDHIPYFAEHTGPVASAGVTEAEERTR